MVALHQRSSFTLQLKPARWIVAEQTFDNTNRIVIQLFIFSVGPRKSVVENIRNDRSRTFVGERRHTDKKLIQTNAQCPEINGRC